MLADAIIGGVFVFRLVLEAGRDLDVALAERAQLQGLHGAHGRALSAQGAAVLVPDDLPGQVLEAQLGRTNGCVCRHTVIS